MIKLAVEIAKNIKSQKNNTIIYFKKIIRKVNKYIEDKSKKKKYKKLKTNILKNITSNTILKSHYLTFQKILEITIKNYLFNCQMSFLVSKKKLKIN